MMTDFNNFSLLAYMSSTAKEVVT